MSEINLSSLPRELARLIVQGKQAPATCEIRTNVGDSGNFYITYIIWRNGIKKFEHCLSSRQFLINFSADNSDDSRTVQRIKELLQPDKYGSATLELGEGECNETCLLNIWRHEDIITLFMMFDNTTDNCLLPSIQWRTNSYLPAFKVMLVDMWQRIREAWSGTCKLAELDI